MSIDILFWNFRGVASDDFLTSLKDFLRNHNPSMVVLVETKTSNAKIRIILRISNFDSIATSETS